MMFPSFVVLLGIFSAISQIYVLITGFKKWIGLKNLFIVFVIALLLRIFLPPLQHINYVDEPLYIQAAEWIVETGSQHFYAKSIGFPVILAGVFFLFGKSNLLAIYVSIFFGALTVYPMYLISKLFIRNNYLALIPPVLLALNPIHIRWSATAETNVVSLFFIMLSLYFMFTFFTRNKYALQCYLTLSFAIIMRIENIVLIPVFIVGYIMFSKKIKLRHVFALFLVVLVIFPNFKAGFDLRKSKNWAKAEGDSDGTNWSIINLLKNSMRFGPNIFFAGIFMTLISVIASLAFYRPDKKIIFLIILFFGFWGVLFLSWFQTLSGRDRFYLNFISIIYLLVPIGLMNLRKYKYTYPVFLIVLVLLGLPYTAAARYIYNNDANQLETNMPSMAAHDIPPNCTIVMLSPITIAGSTDLDAIDINEFKEINGCSLFFADYHCYDWPAHDNEKKCNSFLENFNYSVYRSYSYRNKTYVFYELKSLKFK